MIFYESPMDIIDIQKFGILTQSCSKEIHLFSHKLRCTSCQLKIIRRETQGKAGLPTRARGGWVPEGCGEITTEPWKMGDLSSNTAGLPSGKLT